MRLTYDYRKFPFRDPDLPTELLPAGWVGHEAHEMFLEAREILGPSAQAYYDEVAGARGASSNSASEQGRSAQ